MREVVPVVLKETHARRAGTRSGSGPRAPTAQNRATSAKPGRKDTLGTTLPTPRPPTSVGRAQVDA